MRNGGHRVESGLRAEGPNEGDSALPPFGGEPVEAFKIGRPTYNNEALAFAGSR
ncbi:MAG: hypothetical protein K0R56_1358 [Sphingomonas sp.]|jgi:hypothetical protein|nr:hypothetical protein [Sphingomonas sp.]